MLFKKEQFPVAATKMADGIMKQYHDTAKGQRKAARAELEKAILEDLQEFDSIDDESEEWDDLDEQHSESFVEGWANRD